MKNLVVFVAISLVGITSCTSESICEVQKPDTQFEAPVVYQTPPVYSEKVVEFLKDKNVSLGIEEYLALSVGKQITVIESYHQDKSFVPLRHEEIKKEFFISQKGNVLYLEEGTTTHCETSLQWGWRFIGIWFVLMLAIEVFVGDGYTYECIISILSAVGCFISIVMTAVGYGYLAIYLLTTIAVWWVLTGIFYYKRKKND
ncbi:MAG: hypothetical protein LBU27_06435 [Candidatus Peribacteria bacterium]|nr:hypothetical protein [Candidatus Peribacteria bacterium]